MPAGQSTVVAHIPVYPPFDEEPECETFPISGPDIRVRVSQLSRYGLRVELQQMAGRNELGQQAEDAVVVWEACLSQPIAGESVLRSAG